MKELDNYIKNPYDTKSIKELAEWYWVREDYAGSLSFWSRLVEFGNDDEIYDGLIHSALCIWKQGNRFTHVEGLLLRAVTDFYWRGEGYLLLSKLYEENRKWTECYHYAESGWRTDWITKPLIDVEEPTKEHFLFQMGISGWWIGKNEESLGIHLELLDSDLPKPYLDAVKNNLNLWDKTESEEKVDVVLQGPITDVTKSIVRRFLSLPFVNRIILSNWVDDKPFHHYSKRVKQIRSEYPQTFGTNNINLQITSSLNGVREVQTHWCCKFRTDQLYDTQSLWKMWEFFLKHRGDRILCGGIYPHLLFHPKDHYFWGSRKQLDELFDIPLEERNLQNRIHIKDRFELSNWYHQFVRAETYIGSHYCSKILPEVKESILNPSNYLYDNSPQWNKSFEISNRITLQRFLPFPKECNGMRWPKLGWVEYPYEEQFGVYGERWYEDIYD
jgi:hypothetical protein